jgi:glucose-6-phosphate isomerase
MKFNFDGDKTPMNTVQTGTFEEMRKIRKQKLPDIQKEVQKIFENYDGGMVAIITVDEDENGYADGHHMYIAGVAHLSSQLAIGKGLSEATDEVRDMLIKSAKDDPAAMKVILKSLLKEVMEDK